MPEINIYNMDCMELMKKTPDNFYGLAIIDPPYGINVIKMNMGGRQTVKPDKTKDWDSGVPDEAYFNELKRISKNQIIWGGNYFKQLDIFNPKLKKKEDFLKVNGIIWDKGEMMYGRSFCECEIAWTNLNNGIIKINPTQLDRIHPCQKPVKLYEWLLINYANKDDKILDTHLGSGSIAIACHNLGFELTACELDNEYCEAAKNRLNIHQSQQRLF